MQVKNFKMETKIEEIAGNGNNVDFATISKNEIMQDLIDNLVVEMLTNAGAEL